MTPTNRRLRSPGHEEQAAWLIDFGVVPKRARFFINLTILTDREGLRLYGTRRELAKKLKGSAMQLFQKRLPMDDDWIFTAGFASPAITSIPSWKNYCHPNRRSKRYASALGAG